MTARRFSELEFRIESSWPWPMIMCCWRPTPESLSSSWTSSSRQVVPLMAYSESPFRKSVREIVTSAPSIGSSPEELSRVRATSARPRAALLVVPMKMTSSIFALRSARVLWAPRTQMTASTTLDLPEPLGPTTAVTPGSNSSTVLSAKDLKPFMVNRLRNTRRRYQPSGSVFGASSGTSRRRTSSARARSPSRSAAGTGSTAGPRARRPGGTAGRCRVCRRDRRTARRRASSRRA